MGTLSQDGLCVSTSIGFCVYCRFSVHTDSRAARAKRWYNVCTKVRPVRGQDGSLAKAGLIAWEERNYPPRTRPSGSGLPRDVGAQGKSKRQGRMRTSPATERNDGSAVVLCFVPIVHYTLSIPCLYLVCTGSIPRPILVPGPIPRSPVSLLSP